MGRAQSRGDPPRRPTAAERERLGREVAAVGAASGLAAVGITGAEAFVATRADLETRRREGLHGGMQFTYRNPARSTDPHRALPGARSLVVGAWGYRRRDDDRTRRSPHGHGRPLRPLRPLRATARRPGPDRRPPGGRGLAGPGGGGRQRPGRPGGRPAGRPGLVRPQHAAAAARLRVLVRARLRGHRRPARPHAADRSLGAGRGVRHLPPLHRRPARPGPSSPTASSTPDAAWRGWSRRPAPSRSSSARRSATASTGATTASQVCPVNRTGDRRHPPASARGGSTAGSRPPRPAGRVRRRPPAVPTAGGTSPERDPRHLRRNALVALGNVGDGSDPATAATARTLRRWRRRPAGRARPMGRRTPRARPTPAGPDVGAAPMTHLLVTNDFPPKVGGIQAYLWELWRRLDPSLVRGADGLVPPRRPALRRRAGRTGHPHRAGAVPGPGPDAGPGPPDPRTRPSGSAPTWWCSTPPSRSGCSAPGSACPTPSSCTVPRWPSPAGSRSAGRCSPTWCAAPPWSSRPAATRRPRPVGRCGAGACPRWSRSRPGVDLERFTPLDDGGAGPGPGRPGPPADRSPGGERQPAGAPQGDGRAHRRRRQSLADRFPDLTVAIAGRGRDAERLAGRVAEIGRPGAPARRGVRRGPAPPGRGGRRVRHAVPQPVAGPRAGGVRHRLPGGGGGRRGPGGRRLGRGGRGGRGRGHRRAGAAPHRGRPMSPGPSAACWPTPRLRAAMGQAARRRAEASFDYDLLAPRLARSLGDGGG